MDILSAVITFILGGGFLSFLQYLIDRHDKKKDGIKDLREFVEKMEKRLTDKITTIEYKADERAAVSSRVRILRFYDDLADGRRKSKDSYDQVMSDIDDYEDYCVTHPEFKNNQTMSTVEFIKKSYLEHLEKHDFL